MDESVKNTKEQKRLRVVMEPVLSKCIDSANELGITKSEFVSLTQTHTGFVLVYYR